MCPQTFGDAQYCHANPDHAAGETACCGCGYFDSSCQVCPPETTCDSWVTPEGVGKTVCH